MDAAQRYGDIFNTPGIGNYPVVSIHQWFSSTDAFLQMTRGNLLRHPINLCNRLLEITLFSR